MGHTKGKFSEEMRNRILKLLSELEDASTSTVATKLGITAAAARHYLTALLIEGKVARRRVGKRTFLWFLKEEESEK